MRIMMRIRKSLRIAFITPLERVVFIFLVGIEAAKVASTAGGSCMQAVLTKKEKQAKQLLYSWVPLLDRVFSLIISLHEGSFLRGKPITLNEFLAHFLAIETQLI